MDAVSLVGSFPNDRIERTEQHDIRAPIGRYEAERVNDGIDLLAVDREQRRSGNRSESNSSERAGDRCGADLREVGDQRFGGAARRQERRSLI